MPRLLSLVALLAVAGCAGLGPAPEVSPAVGAETRADLARAFAAQGWRAVPVQAVRPVGIVGEGTAYRVEGRRVLVFDYASPEEAAAAAPDDVVRLQRYAAGAAAEVYRRPTLVVVTFGRLETAFDRRLSELLTGPSLATDVATSAAGSR